MASGRQPALKKGADVNVTYDETGTALVCHLAGNLEQLTVRQFRESLARVRQSARVVFDLSAVNFIDSAGLGALIGAIRHVRELNGEAVVCSARPSVARALELVGLSHVVAVVGDISQARAFFTAA
jgi:anti-anti-sigma factor